jgi:hypothetical protein
MIGSDAKLDDYLYYFSSWINMFKEVNGETHFYKPKYWSQL